MCFVLIAAAVAFYFFVWKKPASAPATKSGKSAEAILRERYARGEVDEATYLAMKRLLSE